MRNDLVFGLSIGIGALIGLIFSQKYIIYGVFTGIAVAALIVNSKKKKK